jgi:hypothetical protein
MVRSAEGAAESASSGLGSINFMIRALLRATGCLDPSFDYRQELTSIFFGINF